MGRANLEGLGSSKFIGKSHFGGSRELKSSLAELIWRAKELRSQIWAKNHLILKFDEYHTLSITFGFYFLTQSCLFSQQGFKKSKNSVNGIAAQWARNEQKCAKIGSWSLNFFIFFYVLSEDYNLSNTYLSNISS